MKKIVYGATVFMLIASTSCAKKVELPTQVSQVYPTAIVQKQDANLESVYPTTIKGREDIEIRPRIDGFIDAIYVDEGAVVSKGQTLFKINSPQAEQALTSAKAGMTSAEAQVNTARVNVNRIRPLAEKGIVSNIQLETAEDSYQSAMAGLAQAKAVLKNAEATMAWTNVSSPVNGLVGSIPLRQGSLVNSANVLTIVANTSNVYAYFSLNEKELASFLNSLEGKSQSEKLKNAPEISLTLADGTGYEHKGRIETITGSINITTGSVNFRAEFPNRDGILRSGSSGKITIPRTLNDVFVIPQKSVFSQQDKTVIYLVQGDSVIQKVIGVTPTPDGKSYAVTDGLDNGCQIVTDGIVTLHNGKKIRTE